MKTILLTNHYPAIPFELVKGELPAGFQLKMLEENSQECLEATVGQADYILASGRVRITKNVLERAHRLKMIQRTGVGLDSLDLGEIKKRTIPLYVNQGVNAESVAEHTLLLMLACLRKLPVVHKNTANGIWRKQEQGVQTYELAGKTIGLIGMGSIARTVVRLLNGFNVHILYFDPLRLDGAEEAALGVTYSEFEELLPQVDILSLHCPLTAQTKKLIDIDTLIKMKPGAILINTARGGLVNTNALADALKSGKLAFAGLDVHEEEPLKTESPITKLENVILTPHIGGVTYDSFRKMMHDAMRNIALFDQGQFEEIAEYLH